MIRLIVRTLGLWILAGAFVAALIDGMKSIAASRPVLTPALAQANELAPRAVQTTQEFLIGRIGPTAWDPAALTVLALPTWVLLTIVAGILIVATRPPRPKIGKRP